MTAEEIQLDRYAKFRKLGQFQELAVRGGDWKTAVADRAAVRGGREAVSLLLNFLQIRTDISVSRCLLNPLCILPSFPHRIPRCGAPSVVLLV